MAPSSNWSGGKILNLVIRVRAPVALHKLKSVMELWAWVGYSTLNNKSYPVDLPPGVNTEASAEKTGKFCLCSSVGRAAVP